MKTKEEILTEIKAKESEHDAAIEVAKIPPASADNAIQQ